MPEIDDILKFDPGVSPKETQDAAEIDEILTFDPQPKTEQEPVSPEIEPEEDTTWREALVSGFQNIPSSAWQYAKDIATPITQPKETIKGLQGLAIGTYEKLTPGKQEEEKYFDAVVDFYKDRYGTTKGFKEAIAKDPVGVLGDFASVLGGAGTAARVGGVIGKAEKVSKIGQAMQRAGLASEPLNVARKIAASPLKLMPEKVPIKMYQSAVKFGTTLPAKKRDAVTRTALAAKNQIMPTSKGMKKLRGMIDDYNKQISDKINNSFHKGHPVSVDDLFEGIDKLKNQFKRVSDEPKAWDAAFKKLKANYKEAGKIGPARSLEETQKIKTRIYRDLASFYEKHKASPAKVELRKAVARNARKQLENFIPEIKQLNKNDAALLELWDAIESKANRIENRDLIGIGLPVKMGAGAGVGHMFAGPQGAAAGSSLGFMLGVYDTPQVKAKIALVASRLREKGITISPTASTIRLGLYQAGKPKEETE